MTENSKYLCYSPILMQYIKAKGIRYLFTFKHDHTKRTCWVFEMNGNLSKVLKQYSSDKTSK